jgi:hypothetical protein
MRDPREALHHWLRVLKPGGHLIVMIPDEDMYEQGIFPSTFNDDHKWTFTIHKNKSWSEKSVNLTNLLSEVADQAQTIKVEQLDASYRFLLSRHDQTLTPVAECALEFILRKLPSDEIARKGRYPYAGREHAVRAGAPRSAAATGMQDSSADPDASKRHRWIFLTVPALLSLAFNANRYGNPPVPVDGGTIAAVAAQAAGAALIGYIVWWLWSTTRKLASSMKAPD